MDDDSEVSATLILSIDFHTTLAELQPIMQAIADDAMAIQGVVDVEVLKTIIFGSSTMH